MTQDPVFEIEKLLDGLHSPQLSSKLIFSNQTLKKMPNFFVKFWEIVSKMRKSDRNASF